MNQQVERYWNGHDVRKMVPREHICNMSAEELTKRRFMFVVVVHMSKQGYLAKNNWVTTFAPGYHAFILEKVAMNDQIGNVAR